MRFWLFPIEGNHASLDWLKEHLSAPELRVERHPLGPTEQDCLKVPALTGDDDPYEPYAYGSRLVQMVNGTAAIIWPQYSNVSFNGAVFTLGDDGLPRQYPYISAPFIERDLHAFPFGSPMTRWCQLAMTDKAVGEALEHYGRMRDDWKGLYMIMETIWKDLGSYDQLPARGWIEKKDLKDFTGSAHPHRHGSSRRPKNPIKFERARILVDRVLENWLQSKDEQRASVAARDNEDRSVGIAA